MKSVTEAQLNANQANAQLSRGPKTPAGKAISAMNRFSHGLTGEFTVLPWENQEEFNHVLVELRAEHKPSTFTENMLVGKMAQAAWLSRRALILQQTVLKHQARGCWDDKKLALYLRYQTTHDRVFHKSLNELLRLRAQTRKEQIGFESQSHKQADQTRRAAAESRKQELHKWSALLAEAKLDHQLLHNSAVRTSNIVASTPKDAPIGVEMAA